MMETNLIGSRYFLVEPIGSGGEARVFRARDTTTETEVALRAPSEPRAAQTFEALPDFHENWVRLLDSGTDPEFGVYQVFELLKGETLGRIFERGPLNHEDWLSFAKQSLLAVEALHFAEMVHGDLNADNFFRAEESPALWKLLELPFLRFDPPPGRTFLFGSIRTFAPEQFDGAPVSVATDLYALGCLYYYAASGDYPHPGVTRQEIAVNCLRFDPMPLAEKAPQFPAGWSSWVMTLLARDPAKRFTSATAAHHLLAIA